MNIAFEGVDKAGKTSLINEFRLRRASVGETWDIVKFSRPEIASRIKDKWSGEVPIYPIMQAEMLAEYFNTFKLMKAARLNHLLFDRFFLGEFIYCFVRGYIYTDAEEEYWLNIFTSRMRETNLCLVYVKAEPETIIARMRKDGGDEFLSEAKVAKIIELYNRIFTKREIPHFVIDTEHASTEEACNQLEEMLNPFRGL